MWISEPMPVIDEDHHRRQRIEPQRERAREVARRDPGEDLLDDRARLGLGSATSCHDRRQRHHERRRASRRTATAPDAALLTRRPKLAFSRKPTNGRSGISSSMQRRARAAHHFSSVNDSGFSDSRWRNRLITIARPTAASAAATVITKNTMIWPSARAERAAEGDERQVHRVQHDLDRQQDRDQVAAHEHAGGADREQNRRQHQVVVERRHQRPRAPAIVVRAAPARPRRPSRPESGSRSPRTETRSR